MKIIVLLIIRFASAVHAQFRDGLPDSTQGFVRIEKNRMPADPFDCRSFGPKCTKLQCLE